MQLPYDTAVMNEILERYLETYFSAAALQEVAAKYGVENARHARAIYDATLDCPVDWSTATMDDALKMLAELLDTEYAWLSSGARGNLVHAFIMAWK